MTARKRRERRAVTVPKANIAPPGEPQNEPIYEHRRPGRPGLLTPEVEARYLDALRAGNYISVSARYAGINPHTMDMWLKRGRGQLRDRQPTPETIRLARLTDQARAHTEVMVVGNLVARSRQDHNAGLAWLRGQPDTRRRWFPSEQGEDDDFIEHGVLVRPAQQARLEAGHETHVTDNRQQVIVITQDQADGIIGDLLAASRAERAERLASQQVVIDEVPLNGAHVARLDGLRSDGTEDIDADDDDA